MTAGALAATGGACTEAVFFEHEFFKGRNKS
jgi:hypothetical protein